jgi:NAD(P)H-flavin reductase
VADPYLPYTVTIRKITIENDARDLKTFELVFADQDQRDSFDFVPGQFAEISVFGAGEAPIGIASSPLDADCITFTVKKYSTGVVTTALHNCEPGQTIGLRGPFGNHYPFDQMAGKDIVIVGGGFAVTTLRSTIRYLLHESKRSDFGKITFFYGARTPGELIYHDEISSWAKRSDIDVHLTVDNPDESWTAHTGVVPAVVTSVAPTAQNSIALVCGPPIMVKFTIPALRDLGFTAEQIITSLEMRMKCGIGKCGRCNIGSKYVCIDGPVFSVAELEKLPQEF